MSERDNLILAISDDNDWTFLELQAEELALTKEQVVAMLVRKARKAYEKPALSMPVHDEQAEMIARHEAAKREEDLRLQAERAEKRARLQAELAELDGHSLAYEPITYTDGVEDDQDGNKVTLPEFDESLLRVPEPDPIQLAARIPASAAPGSLTGPVGVRRDLRGGDIMGDPRMNVIRRNFKHLGAG